MSATYESLEDYTADVETARKAYYDDETARQGLCIYCQRRKREHHRRVCRACRYERAAANRRRAE